jgi:single-strand DNA-binding protein
MNQVALVGNITDDPELRYTQSGAALAGFTVAVSHRSKHNGEWQDVNDGFFRDVMDARGSASPRR